MKKKLYNGTFYYKKDIGRVRILNEDDTKIVVNAKSNVLMIVTDGMGGTSKGDYASLTTINTIVDSFKRHNGFLSLYTAKRWLISAAKRANRYIYVTQYKDKTYNEMGTTLVCALIYKDKLICLNVGDSRLYLYNNHELSQVFEDQTYVNYLYHSGQIAEKEGLEGDDIIGILSKKFLDTETIIVTGDRDSFQLVDDVTSVYFTKKGTSDVKIIDKKIFLFYMSLLFLLLKTVKY